MTITNEFYAAQNHGHFKYFALGDFALEQGGTIPDCQLAYTTLGTLNARKDNVILFAHMFSGTSQHMQSYVGAGLAAAA